MDSYILSLISPMEARQSPFMPPLWLEAHTTPSHENQDHAPFNPPSTRQHPPTPARAPGSRALPCSDYTHAHETKEEEREKKTKVRKKFQRAVGKKRKRACQTAERTMLIDFFFFQDFFPLFREKKCGTRSKHAKKAKKVKKAKNIVEAIKTRGRLSEREAGDHNQII